MTRTLTIASLSAVPIPLDAEDGATTASAEIAAAPEHAAGVETTTDGIDADLFHGWVARNRRHPAVMNGLLRIVSDEHDTAAAPETPPEFAIP